jgi:hypothetical protein
MWWLLAGCDPNQPVGWDAIVEIKGDDVRFAGSRVGSWADRNGGLGPALSTAVREYAAYKPSPSVLLEVPAGATFGDMRPIIDAVEQAGAGSVGIRETTTLVAGTLTVPRGSAPPSGPVTGAEVYGFLYVHSHEGFWLEGRATFAPKLGEGSSFPHDLPPPALVDCGKVFGKGMPLEAVCQEGQLDPSAPNEVVLGGALGCLVSLAQAPDSPAWRTELSSDVRSLDPRHEVIWSIVPDEDVPAPLIVPILEGLHSAGARPPVLAIVNHPTTALPPLDCGGGIRDARGLDAAAARFVGAWSAPVSPKPEVPKPPEPEVPAPEPPTETPPPP